MGSKHWAWLKPNLACHTFPQKYAAEALEQDGGPMHPFNKKWFAQIVCLGDGDGEIVPFAASFFLLWPLLALDTPCGKDCAGTCISQALKTKRKCIEEQKNERQVSLLLRQVTIMRQENIAKAQKQPRYLCLGIDLSLTVISPWQESLCDWDGVWDDLDLRKVRTARWCIEVCGSDWGIIK